MIDTCLPEGVTFDRRVRPEVQCPNCERAGVESFYRVAGVPVHSVLNMPTRDEALGYPRGDLDLAVCPGCGFIFNTAFDPAVHDYSTRYEETQGFSPVFSGFARDLARSLVKRHDLRGRSVLEIGCGKGEFLAMLCEEGAGRGIGIDPAVIPDRLESEAASRIEFIPDFYSPKYAHLQADFICCRHTLEHIAPTRQFLLELRKNIGDRRECVVFFELPDVVRELREGAFWDLYYEHCSYFSPGSLARVFRETGFEVTELEVVYGDQYLLITARPADGPTAARLPLENDLQTMRRLVDGFPETCGRALRYWHEQVRGRAEAGQRVVIWGSGSKGVAFLTTLDVTGAIEHVVDINPHRQGRHMPGTGQLIVAPAFLAEHEPDCVIVMNPVYVDEIGEDLARLGLDPEVVAV